MFCAIEDDGFGREGGKRKDARKMRYHESILDALRAEGYFPFSALMNLAARPWCLNTAFIPLGQPCSLSARRLACDGYV